LVLRRPFRNFPEIFRISFATSRQPANRLGDFARYRSATNLALAERLLKEFEVEDRLGKARGSLSVARFRGSLPDLPFIKIGRSIRYDPREVEIFLASHTVNGRPESVAPKRKKRKKARQLPPG